MNAAMSALSSITRMHMISCLSPAAPCDVARNLTLQQSLFRNCTAVAGTGKGAVEPKVANCNFKKSCDFAAELCGGRGQTGLPATSRGGGRCGAHLSSVARAPGRAAARLHAPPPAANPPGNGPRGQARHLPRSRSPPPISCHSYQNRRGCVSFVSPGCRDVS